MPRTIIKPLPDQDFYVTYSTVVDSPVEWGPRAHYADEDPERMSRVDATGTSALWPDPPEPPFLGWQYGPLVVREGIKDSTRGGAQIGFVERDGLREFCESVGEDGRFHPRPGLVAWARDDDTKAALTLKL